MKRVRPIPMEFYFPIKCAGRQTVKLRNYCNKLRLAAMDHEKCHRAVHLEEHFQSIIHRGSHKLASKGVYKSVMQCFVIG